MPKQFLSARDGPMLVQPVPALILKTALPSMLAMIASSLSALFDALLLSRLGTQVTAAVSVGFPLLTMIQAVGFTFGMGAGSFVSRSLGSGDKESALRAASTALYGACALCAALCAAGFIFAVPLVRLLGASDGVIAPAAAYARYVLASGPMLCASLVLSSLLRAQGKTLANLAAFGAGALLGTALQYLLIARLGRGVGGSGAAMLAREALTLLVLLIAVRRDKSFLRPRLFLFSLRPRVIADIMRSGLPTLLRQGLMSASSVLLSRVSSGFGDAALAGMGLAVRAVMLVSSAVIGFGQGFQPVCGYAFGAGRMDRVREAYRFCQRCVVPSLALLGAAVFAWARPLLALFGGEEAVVSFAASALRAQSVVFFAQGAVILMNMLTQAMGLTVRATLVATSRQGFVFIPLLLVLPRLFGINGLLLCQSVSDILSLGLCFLLCRSCLRKGNGAIDSAPGKHYNNCV